MFKMKKLILFIAILFAFNTASAQVPDIFPEGIIIGSYASAPTGYRAGQLYYNTVSETLWFYNGTAWLDMSVAGGGADNLGNHLATQDLDLAGFNLLNALALQINNAGGFQTLISQWDFETINGNFILKGTGGTNGSTAPALSISNADLTVNLTNSDISEIYSSARNAVTYEALQDYVANNAGTGLVETVTGTAVDNTDPLNPIINTTGGGTGVVETIVAGTNVTVDSTDPANPIVNAADGLVTSVNSEVGVVVIDTDDIPLGASLDNHFVTLQQALFLGTTSMPSNNPTITSGSGLTIVDGTTSFDFDDSDITVINSFGTTTTFDFLADESDAIRIGNGAALIPYMATAGIGGWNPNTNFPALTDGNTNDTGSIYLVGQNGSHDFGGGALDYLAGDLVINFGGAHTRFLGENSQGLSSIVAGANITVDATDPLNPIVASTGDFLGVPYTGATGDVDLDPHGILFNDSFQNTRIRLAGRTGGVGFANASSSSQYSIHVNDSTDIYMTSMTNDTGQLLNLKYSFSNTPHSLTLPNRTDTIATLSDIAGATGVATIVAGANITVDATDPANPIVSATSGGTGDVTAASSFTADNQLIRADGTGKGVQDSQGVGNPIVLSDTGGLEWGGGTVEVKGNGGQLTLDATLGLNLNSDANVLGRSGNNTYFTVDTDNSSTNAQFGVTENGVGAYMLLLNESGLAELQTTEIADITASGAKAIITKEYGDAFYLGGASYVGITEAGVSGTNYSINIGDPLGIGYLSFDEVNQDMSLEFGDALLNMFDDQLGNSDASLTVGGIDGISISNATTTEITGSYGLAFREGTGGVLNAPVVGQVLAATDTVGSVQWTTVASGGAVTSVNTQAGVVNLTTDDIPDTATNRYTNDTDITRLAGTSGTNTGDQVIPISGTDFDPVGTDNSDNNAINTLYANDYRLANFIEGTNYSGDIHSNIAALDLVSGTNTGDQNLSSYLIDPTTTAGDMIWRNAVGTIDRIGIGAEDDLLGISGGAVKWVNPPVNQTLNNTSDVSSHTTTLSGTGGSIKLIEGSGITLTTAGTALDGTVTITSAAGGGNVSKVGTPLDNQIGVWTGDGTIEGGATLTYDGQTLSSLGTGGTLPSNAGIVTNWLTINTADGAVGTGSASLFLNNNDGQIYEFYADRFGSFGVWDKSANAQRMDIAQTTGAVTFNGTLASGASTVNGSISVTGTVDGRDIAADGTRLANTSGLNTGDQLEEEVMGTARENLTATGAVALDMDTFSYYELTTTGNTTLSFTNNVGVGESVVKTVVVYNTASETLTLPTAGWTTIGVLAVGKTNYLTINFSNTTTGGLKALCYINN